MSRFAIRPFGLIGQIVAILLIAVVAEFAASTILYERASEFSVRDDEARRLGEHLVVARQLLEKAPPARRPSIAAALSTDHYETGWAPRPPSRPADTLTLIRSQIVAWEPSLASADLRLARRGDPIGTRITGGLVLADGSWLSFRTLRGVGSQDWWRGRVLISALLALLVIGSASLLVRSTLHPLRRLAHAADRFGAAAPERVEEGGPIEIRQVITAFNRMQSRIQRLIAERTQALAAVGHDLRTPLARLRLRTDGVGDADLRATIGGDIAEMEAMVTSLLAYLGGETDPEIPTLTDIAVLCTTLADDAADRGRAVTYVGPDHCELAVRRSGLKRAISNLLENALHYGDSACLTLEARDGSILLVIDDDGPGIPDESLASVVEPFVRLDAARRRDTVGLGLGLAIVARMVAVEGGTFGLANRPEGGLRATIELPRL
ncbi:MAG: two-component sensor histidine kinase [Sphingomonas sp. 28-66-16]|nr:MAG: two-component sensor histidine kinase [Sphingomonas sp. 28-66-16]